MEEESEEDNIESVEDLEKQEFVFADQGELLVCRNLNVQRIVENDWLRHNIFHLRCTSHGKVCDIITDGRSFENVVSSNMVDKLKLKAEDRPRPYNLSWLDKKKEVKVSKRCLVQFLLVKSIKMKFFVMWCLWMLAIYFLVDHGNMIERRFMMVTKTHILFTRMGSKSY